MVQQPLVNVIAKVAKGTRILKGGDDTSRTWLIIVLLTLSQFVCFPPLPCLARAVMKKFDYHPISEEEQSQLSTNFNRANGEWVNALAQA